MHVERRDIFSTNAPTVAPTPAPTYGANSIPIAMEEAHEALDIVIGMVFINDTSTVVIFDSGTSHSFISAIYVEKHNLPLPC
jgi:hypothetical protein